MEEGTDLCLARFWFLASRGPFTSHAIRIAAESHETMPTSSKSPTSAPKSRPCPDPNRGTSQLFPGFNNRTGALHRVFVWHIPVVGVRRVGVRDVPTSEMISTSRASKISNSPPQESFEAIFALEILLISEVILRTLQKYWGVAKGSSVSWVAEFKGDKNSECKLSNGWSRSYKVIKMLLTVGK